MKLSSMTSATHPVPLRTGLHARIGLALAGLLLTGSTAAGLPQESAAQEPAKDAAQPVEDERVARAKAALEEGDFALARAIVDRLFVDQRVSEARAALAKNDPFVAVSSLDDALKVDRLEKKERGAILFLRGQAVFAAASLDTRWASLFGEAQENFVEASRSGAGVAAAFRASRAARMAGFGDEALQIARQAVAYVDKKEGRADGLDLGQHYARTWAEAAFGKFVTVANGTAQLGEGEDAAVLRTELFNETRGALERVIGDLPTDVWAYEQLANLHLWQGSQDEAVRALEAGLAVAPGDQRMHIALARRIGDKAQAAAQAAGAEPGAVIEARFQAITQRYAEFRKTHPENALGYWFGAYEEFYRGVGQLSAKLDARPAFDAAQRLFAGCAERSEAYAEECVDYEVLCQVGIGWTMVNQGDVDGAIETFLAVHEMRPAPTETGRVAALDVRLATTGADGAAITQIPSAIGGIDYLSRQLSADPSNRTNLTKVAELAGRVSTLRPEDGNLANNAGFFNRDAAMLWEALAVRRMAQAKSDKDTKAAQRARDKAQTLVESSWTAYVRAAALMPKDVRVVNDTGLIMAYYKRTDPDAAERYFLQAIADGKVQLADEALTEEQRPVLTEAWGDAHENMGILEWTFRRDPKAARGWFAQALEIGPPSRAWIGRQLLPLLDQWIETGEEPEALGVLEARRVWVHNSPPTQK